MGNPELEFRAQQIDRLSKDLKDVVAPRFDTAAGHVNGDGTIEGGDFSIVGTVAAMSYPVGLQYAFQDLATHKRQVERYADDAAQSAGNYRNAEDKSEVRPGQD